MSHPVPRYATADDHDLLDGYARFCASLGVTDRNLRDRLLAARAFLTAHPDLDACAARRLSSSDRAASIPRK